MLNYDDRVKSVSTLPKPNTGITTMVLVCFQLLISLSTKLNVSFGTEMHALSNYF